MRAIDGLRFNRWIPPRIIKHYVAGIGQVQSSACRAQAQQEYRRIRIALERANNLLAVLRLAGENVRVDVVRTTFLLQQFEHLHKLAEHQDLLSFSDQRVEQLEQRLGLARSGIVADKFGVATNLAQSRERGQ